MSIKSELMRIQQANPDNILFPADVVEWAKDNPDSALFSAIEWNDQQAADAHRLWQVRQLIQLHVVEGDKTPMLVSLSIDRKGDGGYRSISDVGERPDLREVMLADAFAELERVQLKYARVTELAKVWEETEAAKQRAPERVRRRGRQRESASS